MTEPTPLQDGEQILLIDQFLKRRRVSIVLVSLCEVFAPMPANISHAIDAS